MGFYWSSCIIYDVVSASMFIFMLPNNYLLYWSQYPANWVDFPMNLSTRFLLVFPQMAAINYHTSSNVLAIAAYFAHHQNHLCNSMAIPLLRHSGWLILRIFVSFTMLTLCWYKYMHRGYGKKLILRVAIYPTLYRYVFLFSD